MSFSKKKVMLLNWPILDVGGICTWTHQIIKGFKKIGWEADHYYCNRTGRFKCSETEFVPIGDKYKRGEKIPSKSLGFSGEENIEIYRELLKQYDYVIFTHPSPHPTKGNIYTKGMTDWINLYKYCNIPVVVVFHDQKWRKTNDWFECVHDCIDIILSDQHNHIDSVNDYASCGTKNIITDWLYFPLDTDGCSPNQSERKNELCMLPQWIKWKNHSRLLEVLPDVKTKINFYNGGMEYHKLCKTELWKNINDYVENKIDPNSLHSYYGFVPYSKVKDIYSASVGSIDLTVRKYQNFTHHECSLYGCTILCTEECRIGPYNHINDGEYWSIDTNDIAGSINKFIELPEQYKEEIRQKAFIRTKENFECAKIAQRINDIVGAFIKTGCGCNTKHGDCATILNPVCSERRSKMSEEKKEVKEEKVEKKVKEVKLVNVRSSKAKPNAAIDPRTGTRFEPNTARQLAFSIVYGMTKEGKNVKEIREKLALTKKESGSKFSLDTGYLNFVVASNPEFFDVFSDGKIMIKKEPQIDAEAAKKFEEDREAKKKKAAEAREKRKKEALEGKAEKKDKGEKKDKIEKVEKVTDKVVEKKEKKD